MPAEWFFSTMPVRGTLAPDVDGATNGANGVETFWAMSSVVIMRWVGTDS
jgi:hypothetical protein